MPTGQLKKLFMYTPPNSPLAEFMEDMENKKYIKKLEKAIKNTQLWALELWEAKELGEEGRERFIEILGVGDDDLAEQVTKSKDQIPEPSKPIFAMNGDEIGAYHGMLLRHLYKREGIEKFKLWAKKDKDGKVITEATKLEIYDDKAQDILPRNAFIGRGSGGASIGNKLKVVDAYLLSKLKIDHNNFCIDKPATYRPIEVNFEEYETLFDQPKPREKMTKFQKAKATLSKAPRKRYSSDEDSETEFRTPAKKSRTEYQPESSPELLSSSSPSTVSLRPSNSARAGVSTARTPFLNMFQEREASPGTPVVSGDFIYEEIDTVVEGNVSKAHNGLITTIYVFDVNFCEAKGSYRASISDGLKFSTNVFFDPKLNEDVEDSLENKVSVVKLEAVDIVQKCIVVVSRFTRIGDGPINMGGAQFVGEAFYRKLKPRGFLTPSRMKSKFF